MMTSTIMPQPPDQRPVLPGDMLAHLVEPEIEDYTEAAAEALRANASIKVEKVGVLVRSGSAHTVRKVVERSNFARAWKHHLEYPQV